MAFERELEVALAAAREAGDILRRHYETGTRVWEKSEDNPVTLADLEADAAIRARLSEAFADDDILSEEMVSDRSRLANRRVWIVDPMDGTKEFTRRIPEFAVSIALTEDAEPVVGAVHNPVARVAVWATRGGGSFRDGKAVRVSACSRLDQAVVIASRTESADRMRRRRPQRLFRAQERVGRVRGRCPGARGRRRLHGLRRRDAAVQPGGNVRRRGHGRRGPITPRTVHRTPAPLTLWSRPGRSPGHPTSLGFGACLHHGVERQRPPIRCTRNPRDASSAGMPRGPSMWPAPSTTKRRFPSPRSAASCAAMASLRAKKTAS